MTSPISQAEEYELFGYSDTTLQDCDFMQSVMAGFDPEPQRLLDVACGTGRHAIEMAQRGYQVTGIDISQDCLSLAQQKADTAQQSIEFVRQDMRALGFKAAFDMAYILFNTILILTRNEDIIRFMAGIHRALVADGLFLIEVNHNWSMIAAGKISNTTYTFDEENGGVKRRVDGELTIGPHNNILRHRRAFRYWRNGVELPARVEAMEVRITSFNELDLLCRLTGFDVLQVFGASNIAAILNDPYQVEDVHEVYQQYWLVLRKRPE